MNFFLSAIGSRRNGDTVKSINMKILQKPNATVGQIVKDLELTVPKRPYLLLGDLDYDDDSSEKYVKGVKLQKDIAILETTSKRNQAATALQLLSAFHTMDASTGVVLQNGWRLLDIEPVNSLFKRFGVPKEEKEGDTIFWCTENTSYSLLNSGRDVRLLTTQQMEAELKGKGWDKFPDYKVAIASRQQKIAYHVNCVARHYGKLCLYYDKDKKEQSITLGELLEEFPDCAEFMIMIGGRYFTVDVGDKGIFFPFQNEEGRHLGLYIGEMVYNPGKEWNNGYN